MKIYRLLFVSCLFLLGCASNQAFTPIKEDPYWASAELANGMKYHIYPNQKEPVSIRLIVHAAAFQENNQQQGYAHFLEHMAFNGSAHYAGNDAIKTFEQSGVSFGPDINAYTAYQETVYKLDLPDNQAVEPALVWFRDIADGIELTPTSVENEKRVIMGEFRFSRKEEKSYAQNVYEHMIANTLYAQHDPLGTKESVNQATPEGIADFYRTWYQPQLTEIVIAGNITLEQATALIEKHFASWEKGSTPMPTRNHSITANNTDFVGYIGANDSPNISLFIDRGEQKIASREQQAQWWLDDIAQQLIQQRLSSNFSDANLPALWIYSQTIPFETQRYSFAEVGFPVDSREASQNLFFSTLAALRDHGVSEQEFQAIFRQYQEMLANFDNNWQKATAIDLVEEKTLASTLDQPIQSHLDRRSTLTEFISTTNNAILDEHLRKLLSSDYQINIGLDKSEDKESVVATLPTLKTLFAQKGQPPLLQEVNQAFVTPTQIGAILSESQPQESMDITTWTLSNGVEVWYRRDTNAGEKVYASLASLGGKASLEPDLRKASEVLIPSAIRGGIANFSGSQLDNHLRRHGIILNPYIDFTSHGISLESSKDELAEAFAALYTAMTAINIDDSHLQLTKQEFKQNRDTFLRSPIGQMALAINRNSYLPDTTHWLYEGSDINTVSVEQLMQTHDDLFKKNRGFKLFITADIKPAELKPLLRTYVASLTFSSAPEVDYRIDYRADFQPRIDMAINDEKSSAYLARVISNDPEHKSATTIFMDDMLWRVANRRMVSQVREQLGLDYAPNAFSVSADSEPHNDWLFSVDISSNDVDTAEQAIDKLIDGLSVEITEEETLTAAKQLIADLKPLKDDPKQMNWFIQRYSLHGYGIDALFNIEQTANRITAQEMTLRAKQIFNHHNRRTKIIMRPKAK